MKQLHWHDSLSVQIKEVDDDHRKLVDLFNLLIQAVEADEPVEYLQALLEELITCTIWHFSHEERLMLKYAYAGLEEHRGEHRELVNGVRELQHRVVQAGGTLSRDNIEFLERWLVGHIFSTDMKMATYLNGVM